MPAPMTSNADYSVLDADIGDAPVSGFGHRRDHLLVIRAGAGMHPQDSARIADHCIVIWVACVRRESPYTLLAATLTPVGPVGSVIGIELIERKGWGVAAPDTRGVGGA